MSGAQHVGWPAVTAQSRGYWCYDMLVLPNPVARTVGKDARGTANRGSWTQAALKQSGYAYLP